MTEITDVLKEPKNLVSLLAIIKNKYGIDDLTKATEYQLNVAYNFLVEDIEKAKKNYDDTKLTELEKIEQVLCKESTIRKVRIDQLRSLVDSINKLNDIAQIMVYKLKTNDIYPDEKKVGKVIKEIRNKANGLTLLIYSLRIKEDNK